MVRSNICYNVVVINIAYRFYIIFIWKEKKMIDKFLYGFFGGLDNLCASVSNYLYRISRGKNDRKNKQTNIRASKKNTKKK